MTKSGVFKKKKDVIYLIIPAFNAYISYKILFPVHITTGSNERSFSKLINVNEIIPTNHYV